jgi:hypothetical protein
MLQVVHFRWLGYVAVASKVRIGIPEDGGNRAHSLTKSPLVEVRDRSRQQRTVLMKKRLYANS